MFRAIVLTISFLSLLFINRGVGALNLPQKYCVYSCPKVDGNNLPLDNADKNVEGGPACEYYDAPSGLRNMCDYTTSGGLYYTSSFSICPKAAVETCHLGR